jgi:hypothetical protein
MAESREQRAQGTELRAKSREQRAFRLARTNLSTRDDINDVDLGGFRGS